MNCQFENGVRIGKTIQEFKHTSVKLRIDYAATSCDTRLMATETLHLTDEQAEVIRQLVADGGYDDASQVVDGALRLLQARQDEQDAELMLLRAELQRSFDDLEAGRYIDLNSREDIDALGQRVIRRGLERLTKCSSGQAEFHYELRE